MTIDAAALSRLADKAYVSSAFALVTAKRAVERIRDTWTSFRKEIELPEKFLAAIDDQMAGVPILNERSTVKAS